MPSSTNQYEIILGTPTTSTATYQIIAPGAQGSPSALRTLLHPDSGSPLVTYQRNPDRTINFLIDPLSLPDGSVRKSQGTTLPFIADNAIDDVVVTEIWEANRGQASISGAFFRRLLELINNTPTLTPGSEQYVVWSPNDQRDDGRKYNVVLLDLRVGGRSHALDAKELGADLVDLDYLDTVKTGVLDRQVELEFLIRSVAT